MTGEDDPASSDGDDEEGGKSDEIVDVVLRVLGLICDRSGTGAHWFGLTGVRYVESP